MKPTHLKVARIGNSRGVRIPAVTLERYRIGDEVVMEEREDGILLRPIKPIGPKMSFEQTALAMSMDAEQWSDWDDTLADGLDSIAWESSQRPVSPKRRVAERSADYSAKPAQRKRGKK